MSYKTEYLASIDSYFHVYNRGVNHASIFFCERNYQNFLERIKKSLRQIEKINVVTYCLMPNHFHLILYQLEEDGLSKFMSQVCNGYVKAINLEQDRTGHLFEGKYRVKLIDDNSYLLHLSRYIHLNPVRARLVSKAEHWQYSSCREYYGTSSGLIVHPEIVLGQFENVKDYREFIEEENPEDQGSIKKYLF
jgi:putative transposase